MTGISPHDELLRITRLTAAYARGELRPDLENIWSAAAQMPPPCENTAAPSHARQTPPDALPNTPGARENAPATLEDLRNSFKDCQLCAIAKSRRNLVFGQGSASARLMIIGEGPGEQEDIQGIAFCGPSGDLLTKMLAAINLRRDEVYIANIIKCRPPGNRNPLPEEVANCRGYLDRQIDIIQPELICSMGNVATKTLLETEVGIMRLRGTLQKYRGIPVVPTYHPSFLLRDPRHKKDAWVDMQLIQRLLAEICEPQQGAQAADKT
jgi:DNA polymerase